jgi:hypothetical protein
LSIGSPSLHIVVAEDLPASAIELLRACGSTVDARSGRGLLVRLED